MITMDYNTLQFDQGVQLNILYLYTGGDLVASCNKSNVFYISKPYIMEEKINWLSSNSREQDPNKFSSITYANFLKMWAMQQAEDYINSFKTPKKEQETAVTPIQETKLDQSETKAEQVSVEEQKPILNPTLIIRPEDDVELRKIYQEKAGKKPFAWWKWEVLIQKINALV